MDSLEQIEALYYERLDRFKELSLSLVDTGHAWLTVVLNHELYRFLYPIEPYASFVHTDPVKFCTDLIAKLIATGEALGGAVRGYEFDLSGFAAAPAPSLETRTSDLYSDLWANFDSATLTEESGRLLAGRLPPSVVAEHIVGKGILDMGCGSGRYSIALAALGAREVVAVDYQAKAFRRAEAHARDKGLPITFREADVLALPFADRSFDFVFSNGVLHHTRDWAKGIAEYVRVMKSSGYLYLYASGGIFWNTRRTMREIFANIPRPYTQQALHMIGLPRNRFIFMDTWYVPIEMHLTKAQVTGELDRSGLTYQVLPSHTQFDPAFGLTLDIPGVEAMWGEGEHRYLVNR